MDFKKASNGSSVTKNNGNGKYFFQDDELNDLNSVQYCTGEDLTTSPYIQEAKERLEREDEKLMMQQELTRHDVDVDGGNRPIYNAQKQERYEREQNIKKTKKAKKEKGENEATDPYECYRWGIAELERLGFRELMQNVNSRLPASIEISEVKRLKSYDKAGLYVPVTENSEIYHPIRCGNPDFVEYLTKHMNDENGTYLQFKQNWLNLFAGYETEKKTGGLHTVLGHMILPIAPINSVSGTLPAHKRTYPLHWFAERIRKIDPKEIIPIWNNPEQETLILIIGRALAGASYDTVRTNGVTIDSVRTSESFENPLTGEIEPNKITHTFRSIGVLCGTGGTGKSHFLKLIRRGLETTGYSYDVLPLSKNQFNWASAENTDILVSDDTTKGDFAGLYDSSQIKTIASGGIYPVEKKGIDSRPGRAVSVCLINTNEPHVSSKIVDSGTASRFEFLQTKEVIQIEQELGGAYEDYLEKLAEAHDTTQEVLILYFLRCCLDKFLDTIGYQWNKEDKSFTFGKKAQLKQQIEANRELFTHQSNSNISKLMTEGAIKVQVINEWLASNSPVELAYFKKAFLNPSDENNKSYSISHASQTARFISELHAEYLKCFKHENSNEYREDVTDKEGLKLYAQKLHEIMEWVLPSKNFNYNCVTQFVQGLDIDAANSPNNLSIIKLWDTHIGKFGANNQKTPENLSFYSSTFNTAKTQKNAFYNQFVSIVKGLRSTKPLSKSAAQFNTYAKVYSQETVTILEKESQIKQAEKAEKLEKKQSKLKTKSSTVSNINDTNQVAN